MGATFTLKGGKRSASALIGYVNRHGKLDIEQIYTHDLVANNELAQLQLEVTRKMFSKNNGIQAFHWIQSFDDSFDKNNAQDVQNAHEIGARLVDVIAEEYPNHEIYMGTHTDSKSGFIHNHIVFGSVDTETGKKFNSSKDVTYNLMDLNDKVLLEFGIEQPKEKFKKVDYDMHAEGKMSNREKMKHMIINTQKSATNFDSFKKNLQESYGVEVYEFNKGKRIGYKWIDDDGKDFVIGSRKLGSDFEKTAIERSFEHVVEHEHQATNDIEKPLDDFSIDVLQSLNADIVQKEQQRKQLEREYYENQQHLDNGLER